MYKMNDYTDYVYFVLGGMKDENEKLTGSFWQRHVWFRLQDVVLQRKKK